MNLDQMVADAKERCHRSIGQRARWAKHDLEGMCNLWRELLLYRLERAAGR